MALATAALSGATAAPPAVDGVDTPAPPAGVPPVDGTLLLLDHVRGTFAFNRTSLAGHAIGAIVVEIVFANAAPRTLRIVWGAAFAIVWLVRAWLAVLFSRDEPTTSLGLERRLRAWHAGVLASGALWGLAAWLFSPYGGGLHQLALVLVVYTFCVASVPILGPQFRLFVFFVVLVFVPAIVRVALQDAALSWQVAGVMTVAMGMTMLLGRNYRESFDSIVGLKLRTEALAVQLRAEKAVADAARAEAEVANRAKTQFFAAASHDLRQPLHAMGLFAEALRARSHDPEVARLVNSINESVDALEGLFSELLDITRIDSGGVEVHPADFELADIFRKVRLHFEPAAFEKGLELRIRGGRRVAFADPLLVERIVRNLVSNAIRYTSDGSVLVSCRQHGERLLLQIWDTGPGIRAEERARVFDEFYQVPGTRAVGGEQKKGLGLGLAIVKRLAALMQAPLAMRSEVGRGTTFTLELPVGKAPRAAERAIAAKAPAGLTLAGRSIVVVEDEPAVREGLEVLLTAWGASIVSLDSVAAAYAWAESADRASPPALVIADYRLEEGTTGVAAISAIRQHFGAPVPAIIVTGSTMSGHEKEALEHDFHLLIKPVLPNKLRAMIAFKLSRR
ncbi:MAG TPA: ATP-binding protein [Caldimonas sp.]|jgi:signal transduction histidine kinase/CheY-like chemotaxis protein